MQQYTVKMEYDFEDLMLDCFISYLTKKRQQQSGISKALSEIVNITRDKVSILFNFI